MTDLVVDLCCGAGGASRGYADAGFEVIGVDIEPQPSYPFDFIQADALTFPLAGFAAVHASPPCRDHTVLKYAQSHPGGTGWMVAAMRERLIASRKPWVIENTPGAPLRDPIMLCGCMFSLGAQGYRLVRRRLFEANFALPQPECVCGSDSRPVIGVYGGKVRNRRPIATGSQRSRVGTTLPLEMGMEAMGIRWMNRAELSQAVPPAYTKWIGRHLMEAIR